MFDPFRDYETAGYLRNFQGEKDLEIVKVAEHDLFSHHCLMVSATGPIRASHPKLTTKRCSKPACKSPASEALDKVTRR